MRITASLLIATSSMFLCSCSQPPSKEVVTQSIKNIMPPNFEVVAITPLKEIPGLIEVAVIMNKQPVVLYLDKKAKYVLSGSLINVESKQNLTIEAQKKLNSSQR